MITPKMESGRFGVFAGDLVFFRGHVSHVDEIVFERDKYVKQLRVCGSHRCD
jgi:hypothetical protein